MSTTATTLKPVHVILDRYDRNPSKLIPILQDIQAEYQYLPEEIMSLVAAELDISPSTVYGVSTFYSHFTLERKGKHILKVCDGTACHVKKSEGILKLLEKELGLGKDVKTTADRLFTLETVACLGACGLAPVVVVDDKVHGLMTPEKTQELLDNIRKEETANG
ncbi:NADH-quinone oxidoreductase subunit E [Sporobacter termitidis DSM 10068]|uniref:NADH-quinone oxidoreductase subunit E n=1 Tax=Sporobacter termitidis DSM 10068 TaxID=1123282 RepID=A0A1M5XSW3_9FIRM|nr:NAD(P)H-dependent oxidoreductase subunit E [Sporobacter termitidis]SHI02614.1 NADH-quinone oxidoreductase subunit E [Sporobacter termitidis DSM 10068]